MNLFRILFVAWLSATLAACGGGDTETSPASQLAQASPVVLEPSFCATPGTAGQLMVEGQCLKSFPEMAQIDAAGSTSSKEPQSAQLPQAALVDAAALFGWAPTAYSRYFSGLYVQDYAFIPGYGSFLFRYYYNTGNYLAVLNNYVYVYGPVSNYQILAVGQLSDFACSIYNCSPSRSFITWTNSGNGVTVKDANNENFSFYSDTRCLYSYARQSETSNFCLTSGATGSFAGITVQVLLVTSTTGGCITALADMAGRQIDIYTNTAGVQVVSPLSTYWNTNGCR